MPQYHKMVKHTQNIFRQFDHFVELGLKGLKQLFSIGSLRSLTFSRNLINDATKKREQNYNGTLPYIIVLLRLF